jgi:sulfatase modifying factor 1
MSTTRWPRVAVAALFLLAGCAGDDDRDESTDEAAEQPEGSEPARTPSERAAETEPAKPEPAAEELVDPPAATTFAEQREQLLGSMRRELGLEERALAEVRSILEGSPLAGQGRPDDTVHPMTRASCRARRAEAKSLPAGDPSCGAPNMVRAYDPSRERPEDARVCIDQYEFPNIPCEYPLTYPTAREAALLCKAVGKRLCDAHEWEGACAGAVLPPEQDYAFGLPRLQATHRHNTTRAIRWAYGAEKDHAKCAMFSRKSERCDATGHVRCGSNTYPAGAFPECVSPFGVFDQHGNAAEHMNLPLTPEQLGSRGGSGHTEMKGSWFIFGRALTQPHEDDCRWRAKDWHPSKVMDVGSHRNYHLGFRCCADLPRK